MEDDGPPSDDDSDVPDTERVRTSVVKDEFGVTSGEAGSSTSRLWIPITPASPGRPSSSATKKTMPA